MPMVGTTVIDIDTDIDINHGVFHEPSLPFESFTLVCKVS